VDKITYLLNAPGADKPTPIFTFIAMAGRRVKVYANRSIHPRQWNVEERRALTRGYPRNGALNDWLDLLASRLADCHDRHRAAGTLPTSDELRALAEPEQSAPDVSDAAPVEVADLLLTFTEWIAGRALTHGVNTLRTYRTALRHLSDFQTVAKYPVAFDTVGGTFTNRFAEYLLTRRGLRDTVVRKNLVIIKCFLGWAVEQGHPVSPDYKKISWQQREPDILTLTRAELAALVALDLADRPALDNARALFLIGVYTGLRFSDVAALRPEHIQADRLRLTTQKTRDTLTIPIRPEARPLLARVSAGTLRPLHNQVLNRHLKELAVLAGIDTPTERTHYAGGKRHTHTAPKYELVTTHTARRTFVTLALEAGLRPELIMKITGHKDLKSFSRYVNVTEDTVLTEFARVYEPAG